MIEQMIKSTKMRIIRTWLPWKRYNDTHFKNDDLFTPSDERLFLPDKKTSRFPSVAVTNKKGELRNVRSHSSVACFCLEYHLKEEIKHQIYVGNGSNFSLSIIYRL